MSAFVNALVGPTCYHLVVKTRSYKILLALHVAISPTLIAGVQRLYTSVVKEQHHHQFCVRRPRSTSR